MTSRKRMMWTSVAIVATLMMGMPSLSSAKLKARASRRPGSRTRWWSWWSRPRRRQPYTPAAGTKDLKSVLFNWAWYMGMLRSSEEYDVLMTLDYQGKGTMQVNGQPCNVTMYRSDISYRVSGERIRITGTRPNGQSCSTIEVVSGAYAWNEDIQGAELVPGQGKATPMAATVEERMIRLWSGPQGAFKAAFAGTSDPPSMTPRPKKLPADVMTIGKTSVAWTGNKPVLTYPIPGVPKATATATLDEKFMAESVVVKHGANTYQFTYSGYKDWNNPLNPAEAMYAGRMTKKRNGAVVRDITTTLTETGQMYVVSLFRRASRRRSSRRFSRPTGRSRRTTHRRRRVAAVATPRTANGKPDLTGVWGGGYNPICGSGTRRCGPTQSKVNCNIPMDNFWVDYEWLSPWRFGLLGHPIYKPEHWDKIQELDQWTNKFDPVMTCQPLGLPRHGTPRRIIQQENDVIFFYGANADYGGGAAEFRDIPTDGRQRNARTASQAYYYGNSIGRWEGDTLVIDSINFVDTTWLGRGGLFHSSSMHIIEKLTRVGNELRYDMTIEDPEVFVEPFVMPTRILRQGDGGFGGDGIQAERSYCEVYEESNVTNQLRH